MTPLLQLTPDELLATTRSVRKRLDFSRPVPRELIDECLELALQAPTGSNRQGWQWVVVYDADQRRALADIYRKGWNVYRNAPGGHEYSDPNRAATQVRVRDSAQYLADHFHEAPVFVIPCHVGRSDKAGSMGQAGIFGSILPAAWSFCLAARARGLGTCWTTIHLMHEREAADVLGIPYDEVQQTALIPVAYTLGTEFKAGPRDPLANVVHIDRW